MPDVAAGIPLIQQFSVATDAVEFLSRSLHEVCLEWRRGRGGPYDCCAGLGANRRRPDDTVIARRAALGVNHDADGADGVA